MSVNTRMNDGSAMDHHVFGSIVAALLAVLMCAGVTFTADAAPTPPDISDTAPQIIVTGDVTRGHTFRAYKIANYVDITQVGGKPVSLKLETVNSGVNISSNTLSDGTVVGGGATPLNFKQTLALEIVAIERMLSGSAPTPDAAGLIMGTDPLQWAAEQWQYPVTESDTDPWLNTNTQTTGPFRILADWLEDELGASESNDCVPGVDPSCFGLFYDQETGIEYADGKSRAVFDLDDATDDEIGFVLPTNPDAFGAGLYILMHPHPQSQFGTPLDGTHPPAMVLGTRIPISTGSISYYDLYNPSGTEVLHRLGVLNVKGDAVTVTLDINDAWKRNHPSYAMNNEVPYIIRTNIPHFDNFLRDSGHGAYEGGRASGAALADGTPILNGFGHQAAGAQHWTSASSTKPANPAAARRAAALAEQGVVDSALMRGAASSSVRRVADTTRNPVRFDISLDYSGRGLSDVDARTMKVTVGSTVLNYQNSCVLDTANTSTPCFGFVQSASNAQGERYFVVQIPNWVLRGNGGKAVTVEYTQRILFDAASDNASIATKEQTVATVEFSNNSYMHDYTEFLDADMFTRIISLRTAVFTFPLIITKIDSRSNTSLRGAQFSILTGGVAQCFALRAGVYHRSGNAPCAQGEGQLLTSDASGRVRVKGLEAQIEYRVKEIRQPNGYDSGNVGMINFPMRIVPRYSSDTRPTEVLATEYLYANASYLQPASLPAYLRPATNEWVNDVDHVRHTFYAHEIDVLNGKTSQDVDAIAPFPWGVLARTGAGMLLLALLAALALLIGVLLKRRRSREEGDREGVQADDLMGTAMGACRLLKHDGDPGATAPADPMSSNDGK
ncbi:MAG: SpaA isopeptide-forming pilin-related protein [Bifidobacterium psychraerophilum]